MRDSRLRESLRPFLLWAVLLSLLLPVVLAVIVGLGALLSALGDDTGAVACGRVSLVVGAAWLTALAGTVTITGVFAIDGPPAGGRPRDHGHGDERPAGE